MVCITFDCQHTTFSQFTRYLDTLTHKCYVLFVVFTFIDWFTFFLSRFSLTHRTLLCRINKYCTNIVYIVHLWNIILLHLVTQVCKRIHLSHRVLYARLFCPLKPIRSNHQRENMQFFLFTILFYSILGYECIKYLQNCLNIGIHTKWTPVMIQNTVLSVIFCPQCIRKGGRERVVSSAIQMKCAIIECSWWWWCWWCCCLFIYFSDAILDNTVQFIFFVFVSVILYCEHTNTHTQINTDTQHINTDTSVFLVLLLLLLLAFSIYAEVNFRKLKFIISSPFLLLLLLLLYSFFI